MNKIKLVMILGIWFILSNALVFAADLQWSGVLYNKFLDGNRHLQDGLFNQGDTDPNGKQGGDQGQGSELELRLACQISPQVEFGGRIQSRFNSNYWSNAGGFIENGSTVDIATSGQYVKFRGAYIRLTPGYKWLDMAYIGANDWGMFDPFTVGKLRYEERDNLSGFLFQGSLLDRKVRWDLARITPSNRFNGPSWSLGGNKDVIGNGFDAQDAAYAGQIKIEAAPNLNLTLIGDYFRDEEKDTNDNNPDNGQDMIRRVENIVAGFKASWSPSDSIDVDSAFYNSKYRVNTDVAPITRWSPFIYDNAHDYAALLNINARDIATEGLSLEMQVFHIGALYQSVMGQRREADVLLTEGHDGTWGTRQPLRNDMSIGYGGWNGPAQQVPSNNADIGFSDFDSPMPQSCLGWRGATIAPKFEYDDLSLALEFTYLDYDTNWQAWGKDNPKFDKYPYNESWSNLGIIPQHRSTYSPFQDRATIISLIKGSYLLDIEEGLDIFWKIKYIDEQDNRMTEAKYLTTGYNVPLKSLEDDDRDLQYWMGRFGVGYPVMEELTVKLYYEYYDVDLKEGSINFMWNDLVGSSPFDGQSPYQTGKHNKNIFGINLGYTLAGFELGGDIQWVVGEYEPMFYGDYKVTEQGGVKGVSIGGDRGFVPIEEHDFYQYRMKLWCTAKF